MSDNASSFFLPNFYRTSANKKFLQATVDQLIQPGEVQRINGYIGRQNSKATTAEDVFISAKSKDRQNYQLEPSIVIKDKNNSASFFKDYQDYINQLSVFGSNVKYHPRLNSQEFYSWNPHICWDKFVNFQNYYWMPAGPLVIKLSDISLTNVETDIIGKAIYQLPNGMYLSNGMKISFDDTILPNKYKSNEYYVDGVGTAIKLTNTSDLDLYGVTFDKVEDIDYIVINKASQNRNLWSRYNRWVHRDVIKISQELNNEPYSVIQSNRATRPIIEFEHDLLLFNYGLISLADVDLYESSNVLRADVEGASQYHIDGVKLMSGMSVLLNSDNNIYVVSFVDNVIKLSLSITPVTGYALLIKQGKLNRHKALRFDENRWVTAQQKIAISTTVTDLTNVPPLFDLVDESGTSLSDPTKYTGSTFFGTKIFSYKVNSAGVPDKVLGFPLTYKTIENSGDIVFNFNLDADEFSYKEHDSLVVKRINSAFLSKIFCEKAEKSILTTTNYVNGWEAYSLPINQKTVQPAVRIYKNTNLTVTAEDKEAKDFQSTRVPKTYYPGDIVRYNGADLYRVRVDGAVTSEGTISNPLDTSNWEFYASSLLTVNNFDLDIFDDKDAAADLDNENLRVYVNSKKLNKADWQLEDGPYYKKIVLKKSELDDDSYTSVNYNDVVSIKVFSESPINDNGYYEIPINLQQNPLNETIDGFTFGEVFDHVGSIIDSLPTLQSDIPVELNRLVFKQESIGYNNLRDMGAVSKYGTKFVQHSGPLSLSLYHITSSENNIIRAIEQSRDDYSKFKKAFIIVAETLGVDTDVFTHVNLILEEVNRNKSSSFPYYLSDMIPYNNFKRNDFVVIDNRIKAYPLDNVFTLTSLSNKAVGVYLNSIQLLYGKDYTFDEQGFVVISAKINDNDVISVYEYDSTDGCFIPETPAKLGLLPKYEPMLYLDTTLVTPRMMIQGHDGSQILAYNDYRDQLVLELEKRIYNNIKSQYDPAVFNIYDFIPGYSRICSYSLTEFNQILAPTFYEWTSLINRDFSKPLTFDESNPFTFNYSNYAAIDGRQVPGYWRGIYKWMFDTDRPHLCPWEMVGYSTEPVWWEDVYGVAPFSSLNMIMWTDISNGLVSDPRNAVKVYDANFKRPFLLTHLPVNVAGELLDPASIGVVVGSNNLNNRNGYVFGDGGPVESAWRKSSHYPFNLIIAAMLMHPAKTFGLLLDRARIKRNLTNQLIYTETGVRITPADIIMPSVFFSSSRIQTSGIINYLVSYIIQDKLKTLDSYVYDLSYMKSQLSYRLGGFTSAEKFNLLLDNKSPASSASSVFVPKEDYIIFLNTSSPLKKVVYSGVIVTKTTEGFEVKGYSKSHPYFNYYQWSGAGKNVNVGGISESYMQWTADKLYTIGKIVQYSDRFYRASITHTSSASFDFEYFKLLSALPIIGGKEANFRKSWDRSVVQVLPYGTILRDIQDVVDLLLGYGEWLKDQGFIFDDYNQEINQITNWETSAKEFLFWTTQNWSTGKDKWANWLPSNEIAAESIVKYNGDYYKAIRPSINIIPDSTEGLYYFSKLDGLSSVGSSVISMSPLANKITFISELSVVDDITNQFNEYEIVSVDGKPIQPSYITSFREDNRVSYISTDTNGIYGASFYLIQKEHVVVLNNNTIFNDLIYNSSSGYKQDRIKVSGYVISNWNGSFNCPGFIFDRAKIVDWAQWVDYALGDIVKYKEFYYSANTSLSGTEEFNAISWTKLDNAPVSKLLPNWSYKAAQFNDFYNLDSDNFDVVQQQLGQHTVGYQKRQYLENIIQDDVSEFKFYQGMILEKGTQNVFNKLFDVLSADDQESVDFYEEWALRVGRYGASPAYESIEFILDEVLFKNNPQGYELVETLDNTPVDYIIRQRPQDVYLKPMGYNSAPWPLSNHYKQFLKSPGHVVEADVKVVLPSLDHIIDKNDTGESLYPIEGFVEGDYVWCTFDPPQWNVYKYTNSNIQILNITPNSNSCTLLLNDVDSFLIGSYIGITNISKGAGFYKIIGKGEYTIDISAKAGIFPQPFDEIETTLLYELAGQQVQRFDDLADNKAAANIFAKNLKPNDLMWVDYNGDTTLWATWKYVPVYIPKLISSPTLDSNSLYGRAIAVNKAGRVCAVAEVNRNRTVTMFTRSNIDRYWTPAYSINMVTGTEIVIFQDSQGVLRPSEVATELALSDDGVWLAVGSPAVTRVLVTNNVLLRMSASGGQLALSTGIVSLYKKEPNTNRYIHNCTFASRNCDLDKSRNESFGSSLVFSENALFVGAPGYNSNKGIVYKLIYNSGSDFWSYGQEADDINPETITDIGNTVSFGSSVVFNNDYSILLISSTGNTTVPGTVSVFYKDGSSYDLATVINESHTPTSSFGRGVAISSNNEIAISAQLETTERKNRGIVYTYSLKNNAGVTTFSKIQSIESPYLGYNLFGSKLAFIKDSVSDYYLQTYQVEKYDDTLMIYNSDEGYDNWNYDIPRYDSEGAKIGEGLVLAYNRYFNKWVLSEAIGRYEDNVFSTAYGTGFAASNTCLLVGAPYYNYVWPYTNQSFRTGQVFEYQNLQSKRSWTVRDLEDSNIDVFKIKRAFLYNKKTSELVTYLDVLDSTQGKIAGVADQEIKYKTFFDPAIYSNLTDPVDGLSESKVIGINVVNIDNGTSWTKEQVGLLWWDLKTSKFNVVSNRDTNYRNTMQNRLAVGASVDIYEWVESSYKPSEWDKLATSTQGYSLGISGTSLYGDLVYSIAKRYDSVTKIPKNVYYFWVKNKTTASLAQNRSLSANDVANLISNPRGAGYKFIAFTSPSSFSLVNVGSLLNEENVVLSVEYWITDQITQNIHSHWELISENKDAVLPLIIEEKWFDSLCGRDKNDLLVPDYSLSPKLLYGVENRPRQGMFINRIEIVKQLVEYINKVLKTNRITDQKSLSKLNSFERAPGLRSGKYDLVVESMVSLDELSDIDVSEFKVPELQVRAVDGKIDSVQVITAGNGYAAINPYEKDLTGAVVSWYGPKFIITGDGKDADVVSIINSNGAIIGYKVINGGAGYNTVNSRCTIRSYSVLVQLDSTASDAWSIYEYNVEFNKWNKAASQSYDTRRYWNTIDWYDTGYTQFSVPDYIINTYLELTDPRYNVGDLIKITGSENWVLLEKFANSNNTDISLQYRIVGQQNGTIQFLSSLYDYNSNIGYDGTLYDNIGYDNISSIELRYILESLRDDILIDELRIEYINLFFVCLRYALSEHHYLDWAFKTSLVKANHNVGGFNQRLTYKNDNLSNFEDYISEVKPYRTKIREYISNYTKLENVDLAVTDFDLPPVYVDNKSIPVTLMLPEEENKWLDDNLVLSSYPWKYWYNNYKLGINTVDVLASGHSYTSSSTSISVAGLCDRPAKLKAIISTGEILLITVTNSGAGYKTAFVNIIDTVGTGATANVILVNGAVSDIVVTNSGTRYSTNTTIEIIGQCTIPASANLLVSNGNLVGVEILDPGMGYTTIPEIGIASSTGVGGAITCTIGSVVRTSLIKMKFDRITTNASVINPIKTEVFDLPSYVDGERTVFELKMSPSMKLGDTVVSVKQGGDVSVVELSSDDYSVFKTRILGDTHYQNTGLVILDVAPTVGSVVTISYHIDQEAFNAADRINHLYLPAINHKGQHLSQLMSGVDYGGVVIDGTSFHVDNGWNSTSYYSSNWDVFDPVFSDYTVTVSADTHELTLPYIPSATDIINVYHLKNYASSVLSDGTALSYNFNPAVYRIAVSTEYAIVTDIDISAGQRLLPCGIASTGIAGFTDLGNKIGVNSVANIHVGDYIKFTNNVFGGITPHQYYYVIEVFEPVSQITIGTIKGDVDSIINLTAANGSMTFDVVPSINRANINVGDTVEFPVITGAGLSTDLENKIVVNSVIGISAGAIIRFIKDVFGGVVLNQYYYVLEVLPLLNQITIGTIESDQDSIIQLTAGTGNMLFEIGSYAGKEPTGFAITTSKASNKITLEDSYANQLVAGDLIRFGGNTFGGLTEGQYYIKEVFNTTNQITLTLDMQVNEVVKLKNGSGLMQYIVGKEFDNVLVDRIIPEGIVINRMLTRTLPAGSAITFRKTLSHPADMIMSTEGEILLSNPVASGSIINLRGVIDSVRLDHANFGKTWTIISSSATSNELETVEDISFNVNDQIIFNGTVFGNVLVDTRYYVSQIVTNNTFKISTLRNGVVFNLETNTGSMTASQVLKPEIVMESWKGDGINNIVDIPITVLVEDGDQFVLRKENSDGSINTPSSAYDTTLSGGDVAYTTATGVNPDDIIIDGEELISPVNCPALEELIPGQMFDAVAIKVFNRPNTGAANINVENYISDGKDTVYGIGQTPNSPNAVIVTVTNTLYVARLNTFDILPIIGDYLYKSVIDIDGDASVVLLGTVNEVDDVLFTVTYTPTNLISLFNTDVVQVQDTVLGVVIDVDHISNSTIKTEGVDYRVDKETVLFTQPVAENNIISIFSIGINGGIYSIQNQYATGVSEKFSVDYPYSITSYIKPLVYVNFMLMIEGVDYVVTSRSNNILGINFSTIPAAGQLVSVMLADNSLQTFAITKTEKIIGDGRSRPYNLAYNVGDLLPNEASMIVRVDQEIISAPKNEYFKIKSNKLYYALDYLQIPYNSITEDDILVRIEEFTLVNGVDYTVDLAINTIKISFDIANNYAGQVLSIIVNYGASYTYTPRNNDNPPRIQFNKVYTADNFISVTSSFKHDILNIQRTEISATPVSPDSTLYYNYTNLHSGLISLERAVLNENFVWVMKNGKLLSPVIDYKLVNDRKGIQLYSASTDEDRFTVMTYDSNLSYSGIAYMQFKDMLNRMHFKRLSLYKQTRLIKDLLVDDKFIEVEDARTFNLPDKKRNRPGVVEIHGERIEYFTINGNVLSRLRRGTLGTGVPAIHSAGTFVQDIGVSETIPYNDTVLVDRMVYQDSNTIMLDKTQAVGNTAMSTAWNWKNKEVGEGLALEQYNELAKNSLEILIGGYQIEKRWGPGIVYKKDEILIVGEYTYKVLKTHISGSTFDDLVITLIEVDNTLHEDQVNVDSSTVYEFIMGNIKLRKDDYYMFNSNIAPTSPEGDIKFERDFIISALTGEYSSIELNQPLLPGTQVNIFKKTGVNWDSFVNIENDTGEIADFLKAVPGALPSASR